MLWSVNINKQFGGRGTDFGYACSPRVEAGRAILPVGGLDASVVALSALDGSVLWASGSEPASYCSPIPITLGGRRLVAAFLQNTLALSTEHSYVGWIRRFILFHHKRHPREMSAKEVAAIGKLGIKKHAGCHTFRHSFATHLLADGVDIRTIKLTCRGGW